MMFFINAFYAAAFWVGGYLRINDIMNGDRPYSGGAIIAIMFSIVLGAFQIGSLGPHMKGITEGKIAGRLAFEVIDAKVDVDSNESGKTIASKDTLKGKIEFKNVEFSYPSKTELKVLKNLSCVFEMG